MTPNFSIRDYFIAHAPSEPQEWFKPVMSSDRPKVRFVGDDGYEYTSATSAEHHCGEDGFDVLNEDQAEEWDDEYQKQRYVQWPAAWADAMLREREPAPAVQNSNDGWISVLDSLPENEGWYAVYLAYIEDHHHAGENGSMGRVDVDYWRTYSIGGRWDNEMMGCQWGGDIDKPEELDSIATHWRPIQPPAVAPKALLSNAERDKIIAALLAARKGLHEGND